MCDLCYKEELELAFASDTVVDKINALKEATLKRLLIKRLDKEDVGIPISELGLRLKNLLNIDKKKPPRKIKDMDNLKELYAYRAANSSGYGSSGVGTNTRSFCETLMLRTSKNLFTREDINSLNSLNTGFGKGGSDTYSVFNWRGGVNCKHYWVKYLYNEKTKEIILAPKSDQPKQIGIGNVPNA